MTIRKKLFLTAGLPTLLGAILIVTAIFFMQAVSSLIVAGLGLLLIFSSIFMTLLVVWKINRDIHRLVQGTRKMSRGQLDHRIPVLGEDEVGILARAFNTMADNLQEFVRKDRESLARLSAEMAQKEQFRKAFLHSIIHDITERKMVEKKLAESHDLLDNLARMVPGVIYQYRLYPDGRSVFPYASPGMNDIYEVTPEEVQRDADLVFGRLHPEDYDRVAEAIFESARTLETFFCEFRVILPRQGLRWRWSQAQPQQMEDGSTLWHGIILDVTDSKRSQEERERLQAQLIQAQKMEAIGALAGGIAHDFNNILFPIIGHTEMMIDKSPEESDFRSSLDEILSASIRAKELVRQVLTFSRQSEKEPKPVKMQLIVSEVLQLVKASIPSTITIRQLIDKNCSMVLADPTNVHQIAMNLITNAYHAMEAADNGTLTIQLSQVNLSADDVRSFDLNPGTYVCFSVSDTGHGIEKTVLSRIFEPYFTTKPEGKGTGLGLSVVHGIVKSYHGDIRVNSEPGKGSVFHVYLPTIDSRQGEAVIMEHPPVQGGREHILLVDDEAPILKMVKQMLERLGYRITTSTNSMEALAAFRLSPDQFDLMVTDMTMPHMTGEKLAMEIKNIRKEIPVIVCTGFSEKMSPEKARELGIDGFLTKPIVKSDLAQTIRAVLDGKKKSFLMS
ncbi:MAG: response regulator [Desulfobacteraceae bacterium]|nr:MAG: response regulator [Desulfobacteraceae bacterium]